MSEKKTTIFDRINSDKNKLNWITINNITADPDKAGGPV